MTWTQSLRSARQCRFFRPSSRRCPWPVLLGAIALGKLQNSHGRARRSGGGGAGGDVRFGMPLSMVAAASAYGAAYGLFPIGWLIVNLLFLYELTVRRGLFEVLQKSLAGIAPDPRVQVILIAFSFGAFFEGAAGLWHAGGGDGGDHDPAGLSAAPGVRLALIANTAPVAFGSLGTPLIALAQVSGLDLLELSAMAGRQLPFFSVLVPFWVCGRSPAGEGCWRVARRADRRAGFAVPQYLGQQLPRPVARGHRRQLVSMGGAGAAAEEVAAFRRLAAARRTHAARHGKRRHSPHCGGTAPRVDTVDHPGRRRLHTRCREDTVEGTLVLWRCRCRCCTMPSIAVRRSPRHRRSRLRRCSI